jgi:hypothetical protein
MIRECVGIPARKVRGTLLIAGQPEHFCARNSRQFL